MGDFISYCITFLAGTLTGAAATYFGNKYTDQRRHQDREKELAGSFASTREQMPELLAEMKSDLQQPENRLIREFFISRREYTLNAGGDCFIYYENDHENLQAKVHILENVGYVIDVTPGNAPKYRMREEFVRRLLGKRR
jgi:hypothetical protein